MCELVDFGSYCSKCGQGIQLPRANRLYTMFCYLVELRTAGIFFLIRSTRKLVRFSIGKDASEPEPDDIKRRAS
jgi:hypothetical protein